MMELKASFIALLTLLFLLSSASKSFDANTVGATREHRFFSQLSLRQLDCINHQINQEVPARSRIFIPMDDPYWRQRIVEMQYGRLKTQLQLEDADVHVSVEKVASTHGCMGARVLVRNLK